MKRYSFYHKATGIFATHIYGATEPELELNTPPDHVAIEGNFHPLSHRFDLAAGRVVRADSPTADHEWNEQLQRWVEKADLSAARARVAAAKAQIAALEQSSVRTMRECLLEVPGARERLSATNDAIAALRQSLK